MNRHPPIRFEDHCLLCVADFRLAHACPDCAAQTAILVTDDAPAVTVTHAASCPWWRMTLAAQHEEGIA